MSNRLVDFCSKHGKKICLFIYFVYTVVTLVMIAWWLANIITRCLV